MSEELGGLSIYSVYHLQGVSKLQFFIKHYREGDTTGQLLKTTLRYTQLEAGVSTSFFKRNFYQTFYLTTPTWLTNLWQYMSECHTQIHEVNPWTYKPPLVGDFFLMDIILRSQLSQENKEIK